MNPRSPPAVSPRCGDLRQGTRYASTRFHCFPAEGRRRPDGLAVVVQADHFCTHWRGIRDDGTRMRHTVMRGLFSRDAALRGEFLALVGRDDV